MAPSNISPEIEADVCVIGAGVVGCAVARELQLAGFSTIVVDMFPKTGMGITSRNSEVIHAGIYYPTGSLKAISSVEGRSLLYEYCKSRDVSHKKIGKIIIATSKEEVDELYTIQKKAALNGVELSFLSEKEVRALEPYVSAVGALSSPETGIVSAHEVCHAFLSDAEIAGASVAYNTVVTGLAYTGGAWHIETGSVVEIFERPVDIKNLPEVFRLPHAPSLKLGEERFTIKVGSVVNSAGLFSEWIARLAGIDIVAAKYEQCWTKGEYFSLAPRWGKMLSRLVYPVPEKNTRGLGVHITLDIGGQAKLGPNVVDGPQVQDYAVDESHQELFFQAAQKYLPDLKISEVTPTYAGIRPKLSKPGEPARDFVIAEESERGLPGLISLIGIESPGLTSSLSIAKRVRGLL